MNGWKDKYLLLFGDHMKEADTPVDEKTGRMNLECQKYLGLNRRRYPDIWEVFFNELLNFDIRKYHETIQRIRKPLVDYLNDNKRSVENNISDLSKGLSK